MQRWEYARVVRLAPANGVRRVTVHVAGNDSNNTDFATDATDASVHCALDQLGRDGWELCGTESLAASNVFWLKRPAD